MNQKGGSKTDTLIKLVLIFFISLLSFSVGTYVGKQFSDSQHKLASLESTGANEDADRSTASVSAEATEVKPEEALTDADVASLSEEFAGPENENSMAATNSKEVKDAKAEAKPAHEETVVKNKKVSAKLAAPVVTVKHTAKHDTVESVAAKVANGEEADTKEVAKDERRIPSSLPAAVASSNIGKFTVQVSSFSAETDAQKLAEDLKAKGLSAFYIPATINGATWYRVSVGLFTKRDEASKFMKGLVQKNQISSAIVQKIIK